MRKEKLKELEDYIEELKTVKVEAFNQPSSFLTVEKNRYYLNNGRVITRELIKKNRKDGSAVMVLPITKNHTTILVVEPRIGSSKTVSVSLPAGYIESGESSICAIERELKEETGYQCKEYQLLGTYYQDSGCSQAYNYAFLGLEAEKTTTQKLDPGEFVKYFECTFEEVLELVQLGYIEDLQALYVIEKVKQSYNLNL